MTADHENIATARAMYVEARGNLADALLEECPGPHRYVQPGGWQIERCYACGYTEDGTRTEEPQ
ncbi:hypothetical protein AB0F72_09190 [Actinoplanes sp. NPDC023936]|uniref:hypothetical protein n=1 Tax=Actinoplanes sp. NPDC023936 TaxID=3154910 RepID=UPI0033D32AB4